ncbi:hypothetical protein GTR02_00245 [Kineococcus sp. R8]|uniref:hypothetical protein n=1 Tax=Kineococcus siccus TaxID=2696567 RepID=UPI00141320D9|nr:hypothetical protein [Kineococcus siccus]NAZ80251.1 hypothetical protein [Kineococcus siccus]
MLLEPPLLDGRLLRSGGLHLEPSLIQLSGELVDLGLHRHGADLSLCDNCLRDRRRVLPASPLVVEQLLELRFDRPAPLMIRRRAVGVVTRSREVFVELVHLFEDQAEEL